MPFLITSLAGLSTLLGSLFIFIKVKNSNTLISNSMKFAAGVMLTVSCLDIIPESYSLINNSIFIKIIYLLISINIGFIISIYLDKKISVDNSLYRVGVISLIAIILHNIPEGIATYMASSYDIKLGLSLSISIALHNIPEGISIALPIYYSTKSIKKAILYTFISGLSEVIGAIITSLFLKNYINDFIMGILLGIIAGIMIYISIFELLKEAKEKSRGGTLLWIMIGSITMILSLIIIK